MKKLMRFTTIAAVTITLSQTLQAAPITGSIGFTGGVTFDTASAGTATMVTNNWISPVVSSTSGSFTAVANGTPAAFAGNWIFNSGAISSFWSAGGFTFNLTDSFILAQGGTPGVNGFVVVSGFGTVNANGYTPTRFRWSFTCQDPATSSWTFSGSAIFADTAITWATPAAITYGTALSSLQLNASSNVPGSFAYTPPAGTVLNVGTYPLTAVFTPTDTNNYSSATTNVNQVVTQAPLTVTAYNASRPYGQTNPVFSGTITGIKNGDNITATYLSAATTNSPPGTYPIIPILNDPNSRLTNYTVTTNNGILTVTKVVPTITWTNPSAIVYGTPLSAVQLNATADVPGSFAYTPPVGTVLNAGTNTLQAVFSPTDTTIYGSATNSVSQVVMPRQIAVIPTSWNYGWVAVGSNALKTFVVTNLGGALVTNGTVTTMPPFSVISGANFTVAGFSTTNVVIQFSPTSVGAASNNIVFNSDNGGGVNILVTGTAAIVPQAGFTASPTIGTVPLTVTFNDTSTGTITNRFWNFGDGAVNSTTTNIVTHTYTLAGANTVILTVTGPVGTSSATNYNYIVATNQYYTYIINNGTLTITGYNGPGGDLTIPDKINGLPVTSIGNYAFYYNASLTSVFIPSSVTNIGVGVFYACTGLTAIIVDAYNPVYVSLAGVLFDKNRNTLIQCPVGETGTYLIPDSVTNIGFGAFVDCFALTNVVFGTNVTSIGDHAFDSSGLTSALIGNSVITIGNSAFGGCPSLTSVTIPNSVTNVGGSAFEHCRSLTNVTIGNNVICIGDTAFGGCWSLTSVTIPNSVIQIGTGGYGAFVECVGLIRVSIGNGVTKIGDGTFYGCTALAIVTVGNSLTNIGDGAFYYCASLTGIYFKGNTPTLGGTNVFTYATNAIVYYLPGTSGWGATFAGCPTALWNPVVQTGNGSLGIQTNQFRFKIAGTTNIPVVVEASTNLGGAWIPLQSVNLTNGSFYFSDSQWTNYPGRFYRIRSP